MTTRLAHLSDPHLSVPRPNGFRQLANKRLLSYLSWRRRRRYRHRLDVLEQVVADLKRQSPDHLAVTGDLTHLGLANEFEEGRAWLQQLGSGADVTVIAGNHERLVNGAWEAGLSSWRPYFAGDPGSEPVAAGGVDMAFPSLRRRGDLALIALNSAAVTAPLLATGALGAAQLERLPRLLEAARGAFRVVLVHHSPLPHGHARRKRLVDARALLDILGRCGAELVLHGHGHHEAFELVATDQGDMPVIGAPSASLDTPGQAGWNLYSITRTEAGWAVDVELRRTRPGAPGLSGKRLARVSLTRSR